jgi:hypothetical protein
MLQRLPAKRKPGAVARRAVDRERQRRYRALKRQHKATYRVTVDADVIDLLVRLKWLPDGDATKPQCVAQAISALLKDAAVKA